MSVPSRTPRQLIVDYALKHDLGTTLPDLVTPYLRRTLGHNPNPNEVRTGIENFIKSLGTNGNSETEKFFRWAYHQEVIKGFTSQGKTIPSWFPLKPGAPLTGDELRKLVEFKPYDGIKKLVVSSGVTEQPVKIGDLVAKGLKEEYDQAKKLVADFQVSVEITVPPEMYGSTPTTYQTTAERAPANDEEAKKLKEAKDIIKLFDEYFPRTGIDPKDWNGKIEPDRLGTAARAAATALPQWVTGIPDASDGSEKLKARLFSTLEKSLRTGLELKENDQLPPALKTYIDGLKAKSYDELRKVTLDADSLTQAILHDANAERTKKGLIPITKDTTVAQISADMAMFEADPKNRSKEAPKPTTLAQDIARYASETGNEAPPAATTDAILFDGEKMGMPWDVVRSFAINKMAVVFAGKAGNSPQLQAVIQQAKEQAEKDPIAFLNAGIDQTLANIMMPKAKAATTIGALVREEIAGTLKKIDRALKYPQPKNNEERAYAYSQIRSLLKAHPEDADLKSAAQLKVAILEKRKAMNTKDNKRSSDADIAFNTAKLSVKEALDVGLILEGYPTGSLPRSMAPHFSKEARTVVANGGVDLRSKYVKGIMDTFDAKAIVSLAAASLPSKKVALWPAPLRDERAAIEKLAHAAKRGNDRAWKQLDGHKIDEKKILQSVVGTMVADFEKGATNTAVASAPAPAAKGTVPRHHAELKPATPSPAVPAPKKAAAAPPPAPPPAAAPQKVPAKAAVEKPRTKPQAGGTFSADTFFRAVPGGA